MGKKSRDEDDFELPLKPKAGRCKAATGEEADDPIRNPGLIQNPRLVLGEDVKRAWIASQAIQVSNEVAVLQSIADELLDAGDIDRGMRVMDAINKRRELQLDLMGVPQRPKGDVKGSGGERKMRAAIPSE